MKSIIKKIVLFFQKLIFAITPHNFKSYEGDVGFFLKQHPQTYRYSYANWGSRRWEYPYLAWVLNKINISGKQVIDIGIGLPQDSNFYKFYVNSGCYLTGYDPDSRLPEVTKLSERCKILRKSAEHMTEFTDGSVDVAVVLSAFEHFPVSAFKQTLQEIHRVLKPGGSLIVTLDLTFDRQRSARWAILEKTLNGLPAEENDLQLKPEHTQVTVEKFLEMASPYFAPSDKKIYNQDLPLSEHVYSQKWNSHVAYLHLHKI